MRAILKVLPALALFALSIPSRAQQPEPPAPQEPTPDAPLPASPVDKAVTPPVNITLGQRFRYEAHTTFGPAAFLVPAASALFTMADPPEHYPREWADGGGAFGRNYGANLARHTTSGLTHFAVGAMDREDPRYFVSTSHNYGIRVLHAFAFTVVDRSMSGHRTFALSNFAGSAGGGFVGMAFYPDGFNDATHGYQRAAVELTSFAGHNLTAEFAPELSKLMHKFHLPDAIANAVLPDDIDR